MRVDTNKATLEIASELVVTAGVVEGEMRCTWHGEWSTRKEFHDSAELKELLVKAREMLKRGGKAAKGKTKGKVE